MKISMDKKYTTRDGREVRIYAVDGGGDYPVHGAVRFSNGTWFARSWTLKGERFDYQSHSEDLIEKPQTVRVQGYVNVYPHGETGTIWMRKEVADRHGPERIACVKIDMEVEHGRFDD